MGRSYWFECFKCGYRAKVSGRADRGIDCFVQTILCRDCKELYDAVTRFRVPNEPTAALARQSGLGPWRQPQLANLRQPADGPPAFQTVLNRLPYTGVRRFKWLRYKLRCPVSPWHRVQNWNEPDRCPRCGSHLEKSALPYRLWD